MVFARASGLVKSERLGLLVDIATTERVLPQLAKRSLVRTIVQMSFILYDEDAKEQYLSQILQPPADRFKSLICSADFSRVYQEEESRAQIIDVLECFIGEIRDDCFFTYFIGALAIFVKMKTSFFPRRVSSNEKLLDEGGVQAHISHTERASVSAHSLSQLPGNRPIDTRNFL